MDANNYVINFLIMVLCKHELGLLQKYSYDLAQDRDQWWALVNTVMNIRIP
jgi:hypothetical protein